MFYLKECKLEENQKDIQIDNSEIPDEDFEDFEDFEDDDENSIPEVEQEVEITNQEDIEEESEQETENVEEIEIPQDDTQSLEENIPQDDSEEINSEETQEENTQIQDSKENQTQSELSAWEELNNGNVVKKYIIYVAKEYIECLDGLSVDERNAYINDAIQKKMDSENEDFIKR